MTRPRTRRGGSPHQDCSGPRTGVSHHRHARPADREQFLRQEERHRAEWVHPRLQGVRRIAPREAPTGPPKTRRRVEPAEQSCDAKYARCVDHQDNRRHAAPIAPPPWSQANRCVRKGVCRRMQAVLQVVLQDQWQAAPQTSLQRTPACRRQEQAVQREPQDYMRPLSLSDRNRRKGTRRGAVMRHRATRARRLMISSSTSSTTMSMPTTRVDITSCVNGMTTDHHEAKVNQDCEQRQQDEISYLMTNMSKRNSDQVNPRAGGGQSVAAIVGGSRHHE